MRLWSFVQIICATEIPPRVEYKLTDFGTAFLADARQRAIIPAGGGSILASIIECAALETVGNRY